MLRNYLLKCFYGKDLEPYRKMIKFEAVDLEIVASNGVEKENHKIYVQGIKVGRVEIKDQE